MTYLVSMAIKLSAVWICLQELQSSCSYHTGWQSLLDQLHSSLLLSTLLWEAALNVRGDCLKASYPFTQACSVHPIMLASYQDALSSGCEATHYVYMILTSLTIHHTDNTGEFCLHHCTFFAISHQCTLYLWCITFWGI